MRISIPSIKALAIVLLIVTLHLFPRSVQAAVGNWQQGFSIESTSADDFASPAFAQSLSDLSRTGADYVTLIIPYYQENLTSSIISPGTNTPTDEALVSAITHAHALNLKVNLKLHLDSRTGEWRAYINPDDRTVWFNHYAAILQHYGRLAQSNGVEQMTIGAELHHAASPVINPDNTQYWKNMIAVLRQTYSGILTYSAQHTHPSEAQEILFWDDLDYIGVSAYFPLANGNPQPSLEELTSSWDYWNNTYIKPLHEKWKKPILFTEVGYRSTPASTANPWYWSPGGLYDPDPQNKGYQALFSYWSTQPYMHGVHWWNWKSNPSLVLPGDTDYTPQNKPVLDIITNWFTQ